MGRSPNEQTYSRLALDELNGVLVRHIARLNAVDLDELVSDEKTTVDMGGTALGHPQDEQRHRVELPSAPDREPEALGAPRQLYGE